MKWNWSEPEGNTDFEVGTLLHDEGGLLGSLDILFRVEGKGLGNIMVLEDDGELLHNHTSGVIFRGWR